MAVRKTVCEPESASRLDDEHRWHPVRLVAAVRQRSAGAIGVGSDESARSIDRGAGRTRTIAPEPIRVRRMCGCTPFQLPGRPRTGRPRAIDDPEGRRETGWRSGCPRERRPGCIGEGAVRATRVSGRVRVGESERGRSTGRIGRQAPSRVRAAKQSCTGFFWEDAMPGNRTCSDPEWGLTPSWQARRPGI
jgi:hypothetical protein